MQATLLKPPVPRHSSKDLGDVLLVSIPSRKYWALILFLAVWLAAWTFSEIRILREVVCGFCGSTLLISEVEFFGFLAVWTLGGLFVLLSLLWQLIGKEEIQVTAESIMVSRVIGFLRTSREYASQYVRGLRISTFGPTYLIKADAWLSSHAGFGTVLFDYRTKTIRFGIAVDWDEAMQIIEEIQGRFPQYKDV